MDAVLLAVSGLLPAIQTVCPSFLHPQGTGLCTPPAKQLSKVTERSLDPHLNLQSIFKSDPMISSSVIPVSIPPPLVPKYNTISKVIDDFFSSHISTVPYCHICILSYILHHK